MGYTIRILFSEETEMKYLYIFCISICFIACAHTDEDTHSALHVGPGKKFSEIEQGYKAAKPGDTIYIHPKKDNTPYEKVGLKVKKQLVIKGVNTENGERVRIDGKGKNYRSPRAVFQVYKQASGTVIENLDIYNATNKTGNGAGLRVNQASDVIIRGCDIHHCNDGIFSNGDGTLDTAKNIRIEYCSIHHNGCKHGPGAHNLYISGTSIIISGCDIYASTTSSSLKSRAHHLTVEYSYIHDASDKEISLVDAKGYTDIPESSACIIGNIIVKHPDCRGNTHTLQFGSNGHHDRQGTLYIINNTVISPYKPALLQLTATSSKAVLINNIFWNGSSKNKHQDFLVTRMNADPKGVTGMGNWFSHCWAESLKKTGIDMSRNILAGTGAVVPPFGNPEKRDFTLNRPYKGIVDNGIPLKDLILPEPFKSLTAGGSPAYEYKHPCSRAERFNDGKIDIGAYEFRKGT